MVKSDFNIIASLSNENCEIDTDIDHFDYVVAFMQLYSMVTRQKIPVRIQLQRHSVHMEVPRLSLASFAGAFSVSISKRGHNTTH